MELALIFILSVIIAFALATGSFLNVIIYRVPRKESIVWPGSHCPKCGEGLSWYDNIPLLSWFWLRGRCRHCGRPISWQYPLVELTTALLLVAAFFKFGVDLKFIFAALMLLVLLTVAVVDAQRQIIPNRIILPSLVVVPILAVAAGLAGRQAMPIVGSVGYLEMAIGFVLGGGLLLIIAMVRPGGMGGGDIKLAAFMGIFLGRYVLIALFIGFLLGSLAGIISMAFFHKSRKDLLPFGPYLSLGAMLTLFFGYELFQWYIGFIL
ncbi:MAG TPA: prepilin peptidase [Actinobacteria bacterium]|nr:prepilin peptidase [Actinomycetes bacterium]HEX21785.1 prepilin peptidase [Actinomycetota bacterium]